VKPTISQRTAFGIGYMKGTFQATCLCVPLLIIAHFVDPIKVSWLLPAAVACFGIAARIGYSILVDQAMENFQKERAKLFNLDK
jgi:hypothetical protein